MWSAFRFSVYVPLSEACQTRDMVDLGHPIWLQHCQIRWCHMHPWTPGTYYPLCKETHCGSPCQCHHYSHWGGDSFESLCQRQKKGSQIFPRPRVDVLPVKQWDVTVSATASLGWWWHVMSCDVIGSTIESVSLSTICRPNHPTLSPVTSLMQKWWIQGCVTSWRYQPV